MEDIIKQLEHQEAIANRLEIGQAERIHLLSKIGNFTNAFINELPQTKAFSQRSPDSEALKINDQQPQNIEALLAIFQREVNETGLLASSGGHAGYIPGGGIYAGALGDFLAAVSNAYAGVSYASPGAVAIENEVVNWLKKTFDFPTSAVGNLASGGSIANLIALTAARDKYGVKNAKVQKSVIYLSEQAHHCIKKALKILGLEDVIIRHLELDENYKIKPALLKRHIEVDYANKLHPFMVIASAGTTDVGAIDPLDDIADIAARNNLWFHVDAAYGGFFVLTSKKPAFKGIERADSLVIDPHKGLFLPYGLGAVLVKDKEAVLQSNLSTGNYLQDAVADDAALNPANVSPELTKHFRGMRMWLPLQLHGVKPFVACLEEKLLLTAYFRERLTSLGFKVGPKPDLSVSYFWYPFSGDANAFNQQLMKAIHQDGRVFFSSTLLKGEFVIRMAILSFRTKRATMDKALEMLSDCLQHTKATFKA